MKLRNLYFTVFFLSCIALLLSLGTWQVQRLEWKNEIITRLEEARKNPMQLDLKTLQDLAVQDLPLAYGSVSGILLSDKEILVGPKPGDGKHRGEIGYHLITPLYVSGGTVLIDRGWVPENYKDDKNRAHLRASGKVTFTGLARKSDFGRYTSNNSPENNLWFKTDIAQIAKEKNLENAAPLVLYAESASRKFDAQEMNPPGWLPRNEHRQYATFWFSMAIIFTGFFGFFIWKQKRAP